MALVSIIINCLNGERFLRQAIDSIYAQTHQDFEIIFYDNCSTDRSSDIALSYDDRVRYYKSSEVLLLGKARSDALALAVGEWVAFLDVDDYWYPHKLSRQLEAVSNTDYVLCYAGILEVDYKGNLIRRVFPRYLSGNQFPLQLTQFDINMVTAMVRRSVLEEFCLSFDPMIVASEEYDLFVRVAMKGEVCSIPEILGVWRIGDDTLTSKSIQFWWSDRSRTIDKILEENPCVSSDYNYDILVARARCSYYRAAWLMSVGELSRARLFLRDSSRISRVYWLLYIASFSPAMWRLIHSNTIKRRISVFLGYARSK